MIAIPRIKWTYTIKFLIVFLLALCLFAIVVFAVKQRFDITACLLIIGNTLLGVFLILPSKEKDVDDPLEKYFIPSQDVEHLMEHYDDGYLQGLQDLLQERIQATPPLIESLLIFINGLPKVKALGRFKVYQLVDKSLRVDFIKRYSNE